MFIKPPKILADELKTINVVITGGGTGGHVYPAMAIAEALRQDIDVERVIYVGCSDSLEERCASEREFDFLPVRISGMPRKFSINFVKWIFQLNQAVADCVGYLHYIKPDIVVGTGGYVSGPVLMAAILLGIPYVIHEADSHAGISNKLLSRWATGVSVAFEEASLMMNNKNVHVFGNPLRSSIGEFSKDEARILLDLDPEKNTLLVLGGSQGAKKINEAVINALPQLLNDLDLQVIHQCGDKNYDELVSQLDSEFVHNPRYLLKGFFNDPAVPMAAADLAISRAGSMSLSELMANRLPAVLIPYPYAAADHQRKNARSIEQAGAALYLENDETNPENLLKLLKIMLNDPEKFEFMRLACGKLSRKDATEDIVAFIKQIVKPQSTVISVPYKDE